MGRAGCRPPAVVDHRQPALEEQECRPVPAYFLVRQDMGRAGAVVVFKEAQLDVVIGIDPFLRVKPVGILRQANLTLQIVAEIRVDIVIIACVERLIEFSIGQACKTLCAGCDMEAALDRFTQPEASGTNGRNLFPRPLPEFQRDKPAQRHSGSRQQGAPSI